MKDFSIEEYVERLNDLENDINEIKKEIEEIESFISIGKEDINTLSSELEKKLLSEIKEKDREFNKLEGKLSEITNESLNIKKRMSYLINVAKDMGIDASKFINKIYRVN